MDPRLLRYYNRELRHVREMGREFAKEYPKIAGRLGLEGIECADPYVERLLEGFAFLTARIQLKLDAQFPVFTQHLMEMLYPHYLAPTPSMALVEMQPELDNADLVAGHTVLRDTVMRALPGDSEPSGCVFRTAHNVTLWPLELSEAGYIETPAALAAAGVNMPRPMSGARAGLSLKLRVSAGVRADMLAMDELPIFLTGSDGLSRALYEQLMNNAVGYLVRTHGAAEAKQFSYRREKILRKGFDDGDALLPRSRRSFSGYRLLQEYFACPERFLFAVFTELHRSLKEMPVKEFEIVVLLDRSDPRLHSAIDATNVRLFCTPAINLFPHRADRIHLQSGATEYHVLADRTRPIDFEVHSVCKVEGFGDSQQPEQEFLPFYACNERTWHDRQASAFYTLRRCPRQPSQRQRVHGNRSSYMGSEVYISLVDSREAPYAGRLRQLGMQLLCTNRDLPLIMPAGRSDTDFTLESDAPVKAARCVIGPTRPKSPVFGGETAWRLMSHLQLNYLSLLEDGDDGASALREMLTLYCDDLDAAARRQVEGLRAVTCQPVTRRIPVSGPVVFGRGLQLNLICDDEAFEGTGAYLFGEVLQEFFARYVSVSSFTETVLRTLQRDEVARWSPRIGSRPIL